MEDNIQKTVENAEDEFRGVALGICFGSGIGIVAGAITGFVGIGLSLGAAIGVVLGAAYDTLKKKKKKT